LILLFVLHTVLNVIKIKQNKMNKYVGYYRVSTEEQGKSGLGLESQRESVRSFALKNGTLVGEFQDIESGSKNFRNGLNKAIHACIDAGAILVVKNMSRISRGGFKVMVELEEAGIEFVESTSPYDPQMVKEIKFSIAKDERMKISERTKSALTVIKNKIARGEKHISKAGNEVISLGNPDNLTYSAVQKSVEVRSRLAYEDPNNSRAGAFIIALKGNGCSFYSISSKLNESGFKTSRGNDFTQVQVKRLYNRYYDR